jgi:hypothetical protein
MLGILSAQEVLNNTVSIIKHAQQSPLKTQEDLDREDFEWFEIIEKIIAETKNYDKSIPLNSIRLIEVKDFAINIIRKHNNLLAVCVYSYFTTDIAHVWI